VSICNECLRKVEAKIIFRNGKVIMAKTCPQHGRQESLIATDIEYYKRCRTYIKPGDLPQKFTTRTHYGCPYDCGLCPDHEQHSCLTLIEITDRCNLTCPTCYAMSAPGYGRHRTVEEVERMLDIICDSEGQPDVVQISGGEPTVHPDFFAILDIAKKKPIRHLMVNTNGIRIAKDREFAKRLAGYMPDFEVYLQFDSFEEKALRTLRGEDLREVRKKAIEHLNEFNLSTTLVMTVQKGLNDHEVGKVIEYALQQRCVRGVTLQPVQVAGRTEGFNPVTDRFTLTEVRQSILDQHSLFTPQDIIPVPCNSDSLAMGYALKLKGETIPLTRMVDPNVLLNAEGNTIIYEQNEEIKEHIFKMFSTSASPQSAAGTLYQLLCCLPFVKAPQLTYENLFRIIIMQFIDTYNFDLRAVKKSCVHIVHKDGRIIPFDTMNLFYRDHLEEKTNELRKEIESHSGGWLMQPQHEA
jgi:uncharacterized radical SAM superfamily Fe-S cluster-containing enzyme